MGHHSKYNTSENLVRIIEELYDKATRDVQMNGNMGEFFQLKSEGKDVFTVIHALQHFFLEQIMSGGSENMVEYVGKYYQFAICR